MPVMTATEAQTNNMLLDTGTLYLDYGEAGERILAPTMGGNSFVVEQDIRIIERDGALGKEKGLRRVIKEDATLTCRFKDISYANLKMALAGSVLSSVTVTGTLTGTIASTEYFTNVTWIGTDHEGKNKIITLFNAMGDNGLSMDFNDKDEAIIEIAFSGHRDPTNAATALYTIVESESACTDMSALTVTTATLNPSFSASVYTYGASVANGVSSVTVTPTNASASEIQVEGVVIASAATSAAISLDVGINEITIVNKETAKTNITYTVWLNRLAA